MLEQGTMKLLIQIDQYGLDPEEIDRIAYQLCSEIREYDVESVDLIRGEPTRQGAKSLDAVALGGLMVVVSPILLTKFLEFLHAWALRREGRTVKIKIQTEDGTMLEVDVPSSMSPTEIKSRISTIIELLPKKSASVSRGRRNI